MQALSRDVCVSPKDSWSAGPDDFCVCRLLADFALVNIKSVRSLRSARALMRRMAARVPGSYLIFDRKTRRVVGKQEL